MARVELRNLRKDWVGGRGRFAASTSRSRTARSSRCWGRRAAARSTTLLMLAGIYSPTGGDITFDGARVNDVEARDRNVGIVFQSYALYPNMTVLENVMFPLRFKNVERSEAERRAREIAALVRIDALLDRRPSQLSGGQQQRVALARALVKRPHLLLLDEPLSNLDASLRLSMRTEIRRIQRELGGHDDPRHPRSDRSDDDGRPHRRHERRPGRAGRHGRGSLRAAQRRCSSRASSVRRRSTCSTATQRTVRSRCTTRRIALTVAARRRCGAGPAPGERAGRHERDAGANHRGRADGSRGALFRRLLLWHRALSRRPARKRVIARATTSRSRSHRPMRCCSTGKAVNASMRALQRDPFTKGCRSRP